MEARVLGDKLLLAVPPSHGMFHPAQSGRSAKGYNRKRQQTDHTNLNVIYEDSNNGGQQRGSRV